MNFKLARAKMLEQQLKTWDVSSPTVLSVFGEVPKEDFVPLPLQQLSYADTELPLGQGRVILSPRILARGIQSLSIRSTESILQIGCDGGYASACLFMLSEKLSIIDSNKTLLSATKQQLTQKGLFGIRYLDGSCRALTTNHGPYDVIIALASVPLIPDTWHAALSERGRLFVIVGNAPRMYACLLTKHPKQKWSAVVLFETMTARLPDFDETKAFVF